MLRRNKEFVGKLLCLSICLNVLPTTAAFAETSTTNVTTTTNSTASSGNLTAALPNPVSDFNFDAATGTIKSYVGTSTTVIIPSSINGVSVRSIGAEAFAWCANITNIQIPDTVTSIGMRAFYGCRGLKSIKLSNSITKIEASVFENCISLLSLEIPSSVTTIGDSAFWSCESLTSIVIPNGVTSIGSCAFEHCEKATTITIPASVKTIGGSAFWSCKSVTSLTIPEGVTKIDSYTFYDCNSLVDIKLPTTITNIGISAFKYCNSLLSITIPAAVSSVAVDSFINCPNLQAININGDSNYFTSVDGVLFDKAKTQIIRFPEGKTDEIYTIPSSVTSIAAHTFENCLNLSKVNIPNTVKDIGEYSFINCKNLQSVTIPYGVTIVNDFTFYGCENLLKADIPNSVTVIGEEAFSNCLKLLSVTIPESVVSIKPIAFSRCKSLTSLTIPYSVTSIEKFAFQECDNLRHITVPDNVKYIQKNVFINTDNATFYVESQQEKQILINSAVPEAKIQVMVPTGLVSIRSVALNSTNLTVLKGDSSILTAEILPYNSTTQTLIWKSSDPSVATIDQSGKVTAVGMGTATITCITTDGTNRSASCLVTTTADYKSLFKFDEATGTITDYVGTDTSITIPSTINGVTVKSIGNNAFQDCTNVTDIKLPSTVTSIGSYAFQNCRSLTVLDIPSSVTTIGNDAFEMCSSLKSITIPNGVTTIKAYTFSYCTSLTNITIPSTVTTIENYAFTSCTSLKTVTIPNSVKIIGSYAFRNCSNLLTIEIPDSTTTIGTSTFDGCTNTIFNVTSETVRQMIVNGGIPTWRVSLNGQAVLPPTQSIVLNQTTLNLIIGSSVNLSATITPVQASTKLSWQSSDTNIATVDEKGTVTVKGDGTAIITCTATDGSGVTAKCSVTGKSYSEAGKTGQISLRTNSVTGGKWVYSSSENGVLQEVSNTYVEDTLPSNVNTLLPVGGTNTWTFKGVKEGSTLMTFEYMLSGAVQATTTKVYHITVDLYNNVSIEEVPVSNLLYDVNGDSSIDVIDYAVLKKYILSGNNFIIKQNADINKDGKINAVDFALLKQKLLAP